MQFIGARQGTALVHSQRISGGHYEARGDLSSWFCFPFDDVAQALTLTRSLPSHPVCRNRLCDCVCVCSGAANLRNESLLRAQADAAGPITHRAPPSGFGVEAVTGQRVQNLEAAGKLVNTARDCGIE
jgi:hypothetical protein